MRTSQTICPTHILRKGNELQTVTSYWYIYVQFLLGFFPPHLFLIHMYFSKDVDTHECEQTKDPSIIIHQKEGGKKISKIESYVATLSEKVKSLGTV